MTGCSAAASTTCRGWTTRRPILIVARTEDAKTGRLKPALFVFPTDTPGFEYTPIDMDVVMPDKQFMLYLDDVRLPADALVGAEDAALAQLFAGLNPERIMAAAGSVGMGRYALDKAVAYANQREVWGKPIGTHQGLAHPLAKCKVELELSKLMMQKAASLYDSGDDLGAGEAANMAKYAAAEASIACVDQAVQTHGGNGLAHEYGLGNLLIGARVARIAPVSREMILNFVAQFSLGLPKLATAVNRPSPGRVRRARHLRRRARHRHDHARQPRQPQRAVEGARRRRGRAPRLRRCRRQRSCRRPDPHRTHVLCRRRLEGAGRRGWPGRGHPPHARPVADDRRAAASR